MVGYDPFSLGLEGLRQIKAGVYMCKCPFHDDLRPSAIFNCDKGNLYCFTCKVSKNVKQLAKKLGKFPIKSVLPDLLRKPEKTEWQTILYGPLAIDNDYLHKRHVTNQQIETWGIRETSDGVVIPLQNNVGKTIGAIERKTNQETHKGKYKKYGDLPLVWPYINLSKQAAKIFVCEGVFGVLRLERLGLFGVAGLGLADPFKIAKLAGMCPQKIAYWGDPDFAGVLNALKMAFCGVNVLVYGYCPDQVGRGNLGAIQAAPTTLSYQKILEILPIEERSGVWQNFVKWRSKQNGL